MKYEKLGTEIGKLVDAKQECYGDSFGRAGEVLRVLYPTGIPPDRYTDALAITRIVDKLFRIATDKESLGESPYRDIAGYGMLGAFVGTRKGEERTRWRCECGHVAYLTNKELFPDCCNAQSYERT